MGDKEINRQTVRGIMNKYMPDVLTIGLSFVTAQLLSQSMKITYALSITVIISAVVYIMLRKQEITERNNHGTI